MNGQEMITTEKAVLTIEYLPSVNYSMLAGGSETCYKFVLDNKEQRDWHQIVITVKGSMIKELTQRLEFLGAGQSVQVRTISITPDIRQLIEITEAVSTTFTITVSEEQGLLLEQELPITLMAYDQWAGSAVMPEQIAAFVVPNSPALPRLMVNAAMWLEQWTGSSQLDEYQSQNRNRVRAQVAAVYEALRSEGIVYSAPPASFEATGQRIRLSDKVLAEKIGTCLDTSLLVASCLEACGIYPIIVMMKSHAIVGAWLTPMVSPQMVCDDVSLLLKETADGNHNLVLFEATAITSSGSIAFEDAVKSALQKLKDESQFQYFVDIHRCRLANIRPMPQRVLKDGVWTIESDAVSPHQNTTTTVNELSHYDLRLEQTGQPVTKQIIWERKLLDFSLRNNLLNTRLGRRVVPFISFDIDHLEDHLQNSEDYAITPSPGKKIEPNTEGMYDSQSQAAECQNLVAEMIKDNKLVSYLTETELQGALTYVYRTARTALEENGANSLFLALGMLRWFETARSEQPRYAPILLLPVDIIRRSGNKYIIRKRDEDIMLNITLVELMKQNFKINLDILKVLPTDGSGIDVKQIFTIVRRAVMEQKRWNVIEEYMLGLFSFNKFVMWNDIHSNAHLLAQNTVVASLIENRDKQGAPDEVVDARVIDRNNPPTDFAIPLDVDSSQMEAIVESGRGRTFILHGPPGTGKSQTITNMIANALYQGKRVLFVAEKMAALSVVQARLEKVGLAPFCLELHSNKATKKHFLEQMDKVLNVTKIKEPAAYAKKARELFAERKDLIAYMNALHQKGPSGLSLYECISEYLAIPQEETLPLPLPIGGRGADSSATDTDNGKSIYSPPYKGGAGGGSDGTWSSYLSACRNQIEQIETIMGVVGTPPAVHPLYGLEPADNRLETTDGIKNLLLQFQQTLTAYNQALDRLNATTMLQLHTDAELHWLEMFTAMLATQKQQEELFGKITSSYSPDIVRMDVNACRREWEEAKAKWFLPRFFAKRKFLSSMQRYGQIYESGLDNVFALVSNYQQMSLSLRQQDEQTAAFAWQNGFNHQQKQAAYNQTVAPQGQMGRQTFMQEAANVTALWHGLINITSQINARTVRQNTKEEIAASLSRWLEGYHLMKDWYLWTDKKRELLQMMLQPVVDSLEQGEQAREVIPSFLKAVYHRLADIAIDQDEQLRTFNGMVFRQKIEQYRRDTQLFQELSKEELYSKLAARVPSSSAATSDGSEISILKRNIANGGRGNSIRTIIDNIPTLLPRLCPCMLMSPISVAQYIDLKAEKFDLVIFDEASQMPTSEAVGAIARGKALIVVGDSKQMPPTSFFTSTQVDEEEADIDDMESILDDCRTLSLSEYYLSWHYRSKHESLIAFSNSQYYDNRLLTFPSVDDQVAKVSLVHVDGVYDKGRTRSNPEESKAIVKEVIRRLSDPELQKYSIGIVSFSKVQGDRIEDDLTEALDSHPELKATAYDGKEPIFVKNLENVQGDERDVILFSVGYGADKTGKVSMNFGPLNNAGGERRLNVAVSRARYEMIVFSTMTSSQIDLRRSNAKGVEGLKGFLEFAETGRLPITDNAASVTDAKNVMISQICDMLNANGYTTKPGVGRSSFKVDIAVSTTEHPEKYIMGILCDGKSYYETKTTRDREIVQPSVMKMLGWNVMRVYSIDWYENRQRATEQILEQLKTTPSRPTPNPSLVGSGADSSASNGDNRSIYSPPYKGGAGGGSAGGGTMASFDPDNIKKSSILVDPTNTKQTTYIEAEVDVPVIDKAQFKPEASYNAKVIRQILAKEQPVTESYLCKRLARIFGFGHSGANIQKAVSLAAARLYRDPLSIGGDSSLWISEAAARDYTAYRSPSPRTITEIPVREVMNAVKEVINEEFSLPKDRIPTIAARKLGFSNAGPKIAETINAVIDLMLRNGIIREVNGRLSITN